VSEKQTEIKKLVITINGRDEIIAIADAKKLHLALAELFAKEKETIMYPIYRDRYFDRWTPMWETTSKKVMADNDDAVGALMITTGSQTETRFDTLKIAVK
jgi:hypothetical protein